MGLLKPLRDMLKEPAYCGSYWRKLVREFRFLDFDYRFLNGYSFPPRSICFILTETCNLKCLMCDIGRRNGQQQDADISPLREAITSGEGLMQLEDWKALLDEIGGMGWHPMVLLTGTEPLLYPHLLELVRHGISRHINFHITTNGTLLSHCADDLVDLCVRPDALTITISLDGIGDDHDAIRGVKGTFDRAYAGLMALAGRKRRLARSWPEVSLNYTISDRNSTKIGQFVEWFHDNAPDAVQGVTFSHLWFRDEAMVRRHNQQWGDRWPVKAENTAGVRLSAINMDHVHEQLRGVDDSKRGRPFYIAENPPLSDTEAGFYYTRPTETVFYNKCLAPWRNVAINPHGEIIISPLCFAGTLGNVKSSPFPSLWNGSALREFRRRLRSAGMYPGCSRCCMLFDSKPKYYKIGRMLK